MRCRACGAEMVMAITKNGRHMPVDVTPSPAGRLLLSDNPTGGKSVEVLTKLEAEAIAAQGGELHTSHFETCSNPARFRRLR